MNGVEYALRSVHDGEQHLAAELLKIAERHHADHEVHFGARDVAQWSQRHVERIARLAGERGMDVESEVDEPNRFTSRLRSAMSAAIGRRPEPGLLLLEDLQHLHLLAAENSTTWEMLGQVARAKRDAAVLELVSACHPSTLRQMRWSNTLLKTLSPQVLGSL